MMGSWRDYTRNVYAHIFNFCKGLKHFSVIQVSPMTCPPFLLCNLPSNTCFSSILTYLSINVDTFDDCVYVLDGRLKQLIKLAATVYSVDRSASIAQNMVSLHEILSFDYFFILFFFVR